MIVSTIRQDYGNFLKIEFERVSSPGSLLLLAV